MLLQEMFVHDMRNNPKQMESGNKDVLYCNLASH